MSEQHRWLKWWARTVGMPIGLKDDDNPEFLPISQRAAKRALWARTFWIVLHIFTCFIIIAGNGRTLGWW